MMLAPVLPIFSLALPAFHSPKMSMKHTHRYYHDGETILVYGTGDPSSLHRNPRRNTQLQRGRPPYRQIHSPISGMSIAAPRDRLTAGSYQVALRARKEVIIQFGPMPSDIEGIFSPIVRTLLSEYWR